MFLTRVRELVSIIPVIVAVDFFRYVLGVGVVYLLLFAVAGRALESRRIQATRKQGQIAQEFGYSMRTVAVFATLGMLYWYADSDGHAPNSALYGIWNVEELSVDGDTRPAVLNDYDRRWRRVVFDAPRVVVFQRTDDSLAHYGASLDAGATTLALTKGGSTTWRATFQVQRSAPDQLLLDRRPRGRGGRLEPEEAV